MFEQGCRTKIIYTKHGFHYNRGVKKKKADRKCFHLLNILCIFRYFTLTVLLRRSAGSARSRVRAGTWWDPARRGRRTAAECCRRSRAPFVLLESRIRNVFAPYKNGKTPWFITVFGTFEIARFSEIPVNFDGHVSRPRNALSNHDFIDQNLHHFACQMLNFYGTAGLHLSLLPSLS